MSNHVYPDEYIEYYAERYHERELWLHGITLLQYLAAPEACELVADRHAAAGRRAEPMLLPGEITAAQRELERGIEDCPRRGGRIIEPLHHTRHPKRSLAANFARRVKV